MCCYPTSRDRARLLEKAKVEKTYITGYKVLLRQGVTYYEKALVCPGWNVEYDLPKYYDSYRPQGLHVYRHTRPESTYDIRVLPVQVMPEDLIAADSLEFVCRAYYIDPEEWYKAFDDVPEVRDRVLV